MTWQPYSLWYACGQPSPIRSLEAGDQQGAASHSPHSRTLMTSPKALGLPRNTHHTVRPSLWNTNQGARWHRPTPAHIHLDKRASALHEHKKPHYPWSPDQHLLKSHTQEKEKMQHTKTNKKKVQEKVLELTCNAITGSCRPSILSF